MRRLGFKKILAINIKAGQILAVNKPQKTKKQIQGFPQKENILSK